MAIPNDLPSALIILSFGVGEDISFDLTNIERFAASVFAFDPTAKSLAWIREQDLPISFRWHAVGLAASDGMAGFEPPRHDGFVSFRKARSTSGAIVLPVQRVITILKNLNLRIPDIVKMDIEGFEYEVLDDMMQCKIYPKMLLVEFHHGMFGAARRRTRVAVEMLREHGYAIFAISATGKEYGFLRYRQKLTP